VLAVSWQGGDRIDRAYTDLLDELAERRTTVGRLAGMERWSPAPSVLRSADADDVPAEIRIAAARLEQIAEQAGTTTARGRAAVGLLVIGEVDRSIGVLVGLTDEHPSNAALWSDLSVAYLERHRRRGDPADARLAFEAAARAVAIAPSLVTAWFNLAIAAEQAGEHGAALEAVGKLEALSPASPWTREVQDRVRGATNGRPLRP
jgi:hypothetical protein